MKAGRKNLVGTTFWFLISAFIAVESYRLGLGTWTIPGPGYFPFGASVLLGIISLSALAKALLSESSEERQKDEMQSPGPLKWGNLILTLGGMLAFSTILNSLGFVLSTFLLMMFFLRIIGRQSVRVSFATALCITVASYLIFELALDSQLPKGILEGYF